MAHFFQSVHIDDSAAVNFGEFYLCQSDVFDGHRCENVSAYTPRPTMIPTDQPTSAPTIEPSIQPTNQPSTDPTKFPTDQPSKEPTTQPTIIPTLLPTLQPSVEPTAIPSAQPVSYNLTWFNDSTTTTTMLTTTTLTTTSDTTTMGSTSNTIETTTTSSMPGSTAGQNITTTDEPGDVSGFWDWIDPGDFEFISFLVLSCCLVLGALSAAGSFLHYKCKKQKFDTPKYFVFWTFFQNAGDFWSDLFFSLILLFDKYYFLSLLSFVFTMFPFIMQLIVAVYFVLKWKHWKQDNQIRLQNYVNKYEVVMYLLTMVGGFYNTIDLIKTNAFYLSIFSFPLKVEEADQLRKYRFSNIVLFENLPQLAIQILYIFGFGRVFNVFGSSNDDGKEIDQLSPIVFVSMMFSILSIVFASVKECSRVCDNICTSRTNSNALSGNHTHETTIKASLVIKSTKLVPNHVFCKGKVGKCLHGTLDTCSNARKWTGRSDFVYFIEVYYISELIYGLNQLEAFFDVKIEHSMQDAASQQVLDTFLRTLQTIGNDRTFKNLISAGLRIDTNSIRSIQIGQFSCNTDVRYSGQLVFSQSGSSAVNKIAPVASLTSTSLASQMQASGSGHDHDIEMETLQALGDMKTKGNFSNTETEGMGDEVIYQMGTTLQKENNESDHSESQIHHDDEGFQASNATTTIKR